MSSGRESTWDEVRRHRHFYLFISPFFILFAVLGLYPLLFSLFLSFMQWNGMTPWHWVGLANFQRMAGDEILWRSLQNTLVIGLMYVPPMMIMAFAFAQILNLQWLKCKSVFRAAYFLPCVTPMVVIAIVFQLIFSAEKGVLNYGVLWLSHLAPFLHLKPIQWLASEDWSKVSVSLLVVWRWTGYNMVLMLAGLQGIPVEYYEAAFVDGASLLQRVYYITVPLMRPTFLFCGLLSLLGTIYMFDEIFVLTNGGPGTSSTNFGMYLFTITFDNFRFGYASCVAYTVAIAVILCTVLVTRWSHRGGEEAEA